MSVKNQSTEDVKPPVPESFKCTITAAEDRFSTLVDPRKTRDTLMAAGRILGNDVAMGYCDVESCNEDRVTEQERPVGWWCNRPLVARHASDICIVDGPCPEQTQQWQNSNMPCGIMKENENVENIE